MKMFLIFVETRWESDLRASQPLWRDGRQQARDE